MLCTACQTEVPAGAAFCSKCGAKVGAPAGAATTPVEKMRAAQAAGAASTDPEQELWHGGFSPKAMYGTWILAVLVTVAGVVVSILAPPPTFLAAAAVVAAFWIISVGYYLIARWSVDYRLTTQRLVHKTGILRQVTNRIEVIDVDDVQFVQGILERLFGVGTIKLLSSDTSDPTLILRGIDNVQQVASLIDNARREERRKRGLYMEAV